MRTLLRAALVAAALSAPLAVTSGASADLPAPDGEKYVSFTVVVENLAAFPDMVVVAYPWSLSGGAPTTEHARVEDAKPLAVGRRSPQPKLWAIAKADYDAFAATYEATHDFQDPALDELFKSDKVRACDAVVTPSHQLPDSDPRDTIVQSFRAEAVSKDACHIVAKAATPAPGGGDDRVHTGGPAGPKSGGCAACTASASAAGAERHLGFAAAAAFAVGVALASRRRRR